MGSGGSNSSRPVSVGGIARIARAARTVNRSLVTVTPLAVCVTFRTGVDSFTRLPSAAAIRSDSDCAPCTKRRSWAPPCTSISRSKVPGFFSSPAQATYQSA